MRGFKAYKGQADSLEGVKAASDFQHSVTFLKVVDPLRIMLTLLCLCSINRIA